MGSSAVTLLAVPTEMEARLVLNRLDAERVVAPNYFPPLFRASSIELAITGVGLMHTAQSLGSLLTAHRYDRALLFGIGGSFKPEFAVGSVTRVLSEEQSDFGAELSPRGFQSLFTMPFMKPSTSPYRSGVVFATSPCPFGTPASIPAVRSVSVNTVLGREESIAEARARCNPDIVNMEGAAFMYCCAVHEVPCTELRGISDIVEPRNTSKWNIPAAIQAVSARVIELLANGPSKAG